MRLSIPSWRNTRRVVRLVRLATHLLAGAFVAHVVFAVLEKLPRERGTLLRDALVRWWTSTLCRRLNLRIHIDGELSQRTTLFVTNHVSWLDIPCLQATLNAAFVSKQEVLAWPVVGAMAARAETIFLERGGRNAAAATADQMTWRLASRRNVVMFPEGTTTDGTRVGIFHARLYQAATRTHSSVQAIAVRYGDDEAPCRVAPFINDDELVPHLWRLLEQDHLTVRLTLCEPIIPGTDRRSLAAATRDQICTALSLNAEQELARGQTLA